MPAGGGFDWGAMPGITARDFFVNYISAKSVNICVLLHQMYHILLKKL